MFWSCSFFIIVGIRFVLGVGGEGVVASALVRPEASLVLEQVFHERLLVASGFLVGRQRTVKYPNY